MCNMEFLLAVDLGINTGLALFGSDGRLYWFRSKNFGSASRLRRAIPWLLNQEKDITTVIIEGGGPLLKIWDAEFNKRNLTVLRIMADQWRQEIFYQREYRSRKDAKENAKYYATKVIEKLSEIGLTSLNENTAEAILIGLYGMKMLHWVDSINKTLR